MRSLVMSIYFIMDSNNFFFFFLLNLLPDHLIVCYLSFVAYMNPYLCIIGFISLLRESD